MKKTFTFLLMAFLALAGFKSWGQETIEIGDGNDISYHFPFSSYYNYSYNEMLYTADEIRTAGTITSISFYAIETTSETYTLDIYMRNVDKTQFSSTTDFIHSSSEDLVWSGQVSGSQSGWVTFELNTPFAYDGTHSLMIAFDNNSGLYKQWYFKQHIIDLMAIAACDDYSNQDPSNPTGNNLHDRIRPNIKIGITPAGGCPAPTGLAASNVTATDATISWNNNGAESYNLDVNGTVYENVTNPYILDVELSTTYTVKVQAVCGEDETSAWSSGINFTTPDCWDGHTINYTLNDSYGDGWNGAKLTIVDKSNNNTIKTLTVSFGQTESGSLTLCSGTYDFVWHTGTYDDECSFSISENGKTLFTCYDASAYTTGQVVYTLGLLEKFAITLIQPEDAAVGTISADYEQAAAGTTVTLSTDFNLGYTLNYIMVDEEPIEGNTFEMPEHDVTVSVAYNTLDMYDITFDPEIDNDIISVSATYNGEPVTEAPAGTVITLSYSNLDEGYTFNYWTLNGAQLTGSTFEMPEEDAVIGVNLTERTRYAVAIDSDVQDYITADPSSDILGGTTVTLTISPATGYVLAELHVLDEDENEQDVTINPENSNIRTFIMPESNVTVSVVFSPVYNISIDMALVGGSISQMSDQGALSAYPAGTRVFLFDNPDEDYSFVENSFIVIRSDGEIGPTVTYTNMVYSFIMPESNVTVSATFNKTAFAVSQVITPTYSGSFSISKTAHVGIGETVTLSYFNASPGYYFDFEDVNSLVVKRNDNQETVEVNNYGNIYQFAMPTSDVTVTATFKELPRYSVFVGDVVNGTIYLDNPYQDILAGDIIYFEVEPEIGYTLESITVTPEEGNPFEPTQQAWYYYFTMPSSNVTISATFCEFQSYTINYYVNGELDRTMQCYEDRFVNNEGPQYIDVPAGMTFEGWGFAEIGTYVTEKPAVLGNAEKPTQDYNLYAVLSYTESVQSGETWKKVTSTSELSAGDEIVLVYGNYVMGGLWGTEDYHRYEVSIANNEISNLPSNANVLTLVASGINWKLQYFESEISNTTTLSYNYNTRDCLSYYGYGNISYDEWTAIESSGVMFYNNNKYIGNHPNGNFITVVDNTNTACKAYKKGASVITTNYYMTEVLADGEVTENTTAKNIIITTGTVTVDNDIVLTMNENGLFRNENAANFVFEDGAQLIYDGDETVNATMKKNINCNASKASNVNWYTISSPLAANTEFANVTNLIPTAVTATDYDLYYLDEENGFWVNARPEAEQTSDFTTIDKGRGYIYSNTTAADIAFAGEINVADVECNLTIGVANGFNLIGNPFMQNIELANVTDVTLADGFYVLNNDNTWGTEPMTGEIKPLQGFLVQATEEGGTARISKNASVRGERSKEQSTSIEMIVSNSNHRDNAYAMFGESTGLNKVSHRNAQAPMLYIPQDGEDFAIAFMNENTTVFPVSFKAMTTGKYSISLKATDDISTLVLVDNMTGTETNMLLEESYSFIGSPADNENRFTVKLAISQSNDEDASFVYQNGKELVVNGEGTLQVFDVLGRVVISEEVHGQTVNVGGLNTGAYIVRLTGESVMTQKIVVR
ncbi:MAG: T9SS type A sorting domain-containing protein [Bacteroidales bacterium]|nr:T9SS type A sorting domain-containing protein [Bacteroidales bacterium]